MGLRIRVWGKGFGVYKVGVWGLGFGLRGKVVWHVIPLGGLRILQSIMANPDRERLGVRV